MSTLHIALFTMIPVAAALAAGLLTAWHRPGPRLEALIQHLAAGVIFAAATLELLPRERGGQRLPVILGFMLGMLLMLLVRELERRRPAGGGDRRLPIGLVAATGGDLLIDGLVLGIGFGIGERTGMLLASALSLEVLFIGLTLATAVKNGGGPLPAVIAMPAMVAFALVVGSVAGTMLLPYLSNFAFTLLLGLGTVVFLYLVTEELLAEAHEREDSRWSAPAFFSGFLLFLLLEMSFHGA